VKIVEVKNLKSLARRLSSLEGVNLGPADREAIIEEFEAFDRVLAELEAFSDGVDWLALPAQPSEQDTHHAR